MPAMVVTADPAPPRQRRPRRRRSRLGGEAAASYPLAFLVAGMLFAAAVGVLMVGTQQAPSGEEQAVGSRQDADARVVLDMLLGRPGDWSAGPDAPDIPGLLNDNRTGLDPLRLDYLHGAGVDATANGLLDSDELLVAMGLDPAAYGVHVRIKERYAVSPVEVNHQHATLRTAFIGDWDGLGPETIQRDTDEAMAQAARGLLDQNASASAVSDRELLRSLSFDFDDEIHLATEPQVTVQTPGLPDEPLHQVVTDQAVLGGDVYPDSKQYLNTVLAGRLSEYDVLVIGTGVGHNALTSNNVKFAIRDWVQAGGMLVVFGSPSASSTWLRPIWDLTTESEAGGLAAPDAGHHVLTYPYTLDWEEYGHTGTAWDLSSMDPDEVDDVLVSDDSAILSYLSGGAAGSGTAALTSIDFTDVADRLGDDEAQRLLTNLISNVRPATLYPLGLEYGEPIPSDIPVSVARGSDVGWFPGFGFVPVDVEVFLWRTAR